METSSGNPQSVVTVTGAAGFIGSQLMPALEAAGWRVRAAGHTEARWGPALAGAEAVVHLAARVHHLGEDGPEANAAYERDNVDLTRTLAAAAIAAGVRRFIFLSSVKAMGESTEAGMRLDEAAPCRPRDAYGRSKLGAEEAILAVARGSNLEPIILRSPLVYGPGVKANMARLFRAVGRGLPLPLASVNNARSLVYVGNLVDAILACLRHPKAAGETFLVSDGEDLSTPELVRRIAKAMGRPARLVPMPVPFLRTVAALVGRSDEAGRLMDSLAVDSSKLRRTIGWKPPYTVNEGLRKTAESF